jgi:uncharacterized protein YdaU (DUF1376 family)
MAESPAFSFYAKDFLVGTATLSLAERGAYITLLCFQWDHGGIPDDPQQRARLLNSTVKQAEALWERLRPKFQQDDDGTWRNARMESERMKQVARRDALAMSGAKGAQSRWHSQANGQAMAPPMAKPLPPPAIQNDGLAFSSSSSSSGVLSERSTREPGARVQAFMDYYTDAHQRIFKIAYFGTNNDYTTALRLVATFTDQQLRDAAIVWFGMDDDFATNGTRTVPKFASRITHCLELMQQKGLAS